MITGQSKLSEDKKRNIVSYFFFNPNQSLKTIAERFDVNASTVSDVLSKHFKTLKKDQIVYRTMRSKV